ncbi:MAG: type II secretion system F family protein, partial [Thermoplasmatota archaeon]
MTEFQRASYKMLGGVGARFANEKLSLDLRRSRQGMRPEAYLANAIAVAAISVLVGFFVSAFVFFFVVPLLLPDAPKALMLLFPVVPILMGLVTYATLAAAPASKAKARAKNIDLKLPYALNYIAAMASAGVNIDQVFRSLAEQKIYGECAREADWIYRHMALFGYDHVTAMKRSIARSPSDNWGEFMQGAITTVTSGGDLQLYFSTKAQRYAWENRQTQKQYIDMMGLMAETYVTACVAGPLFLIVMMAIMGMLGGSGPAQLYLV